MNAEWIYFARELLINVAANFLCAWIRVYFNDFVEISLQRHENCCFVAWNTPHLFMLHENEPTVYHKLSATTTKKRGEPDDDVVNLNCTEN